ncbi:MAG: hypothetical protein IT454_02750 [Planctomycetes bacterium]|nr:hypothetical protein [Planctomycetota bacterium]
MIDFQRGVRGWARRTALVLSLGLLSCSAPANPPQDATAASVSNASKGFGVPDAVRAALLKGEFDRALAGIDAAAADKPEQSEWWAYLRGSTLAQARRLEAALEAFQALEAREPASSFRSKARFARADVLREMGRVREAESIYEAEATRLLSERRQVELAAIYFEFADALSTPQARDAAGPNKLDYARAIVLYGKVLELDVPAATRERAQYRQVVCARAQERWDDVVQLCERYRATFDPTVKGARSAGTHVFEVLLGSAQARLNSKNLAGARIALEDLIAALDDARAGASPWEAWRAERDGPALLGLDTLETEAHFALAETYETGDATANLLAIAALRRILARFPAHERGAQVHFAIAERLERSARSEEALAAFARVIEWNDGPQASAEALERSAAFRRDALYRRAVLLLGLERFADGIAALSDYVARFPTGPDWTSAQQGIVDAEFAIGASALRDQKFDDARRAWSEFLARRPLDPRSPQVQFDLAALCVTQATALRESARKDGREAAAADLEALFRSAIEQWRRVQAKYAKSELASRALLEIGKLEELELGNLEAAVLAYRECTFGSAAGEASQRLVELTQPSLVLSTERAWRTDEKARVKLWARNLEKLVVEVYALDLEAYFRKNLGHAGVDDLDLDLIASDQKFEAAFEGFAPYKPLQRDVELPVTGAGVWAVAVTAGELRATTLVVSSDIDLTTRRSALQGLAFAQDARTGAAARGVRVLFAGRAPDGTPAIVEGTTGDDGTALVSLAALDANVPVNTLGLRQGHAASTLGSAVAARFTDTLAARGSLFTDRSVYRPGESVRWRALVREVLEGRLAVEAGAKLALAVRDEQGRLVHAQDVVASKFGSVHGEWALDADAPLGTYVATVTTPRGTQVTGQFEVKLYQAPRVRLELESGREVYYRGETIELVARASYAWGEPLAGTPVRIEFGRLYELTTDARGEARFALPSRDIFGEREVQIRALLPQENASARTTVLVASSEFGASLSVAEPTVLAGSSFDVELRTRVFGGAPIAKAMKLEVLLRRATGGTWTEEKQDERQLATDAQGIAHTTLQLARGGTYMLRARAVDRFDNPIEAELALFVSGDDDPQRLRFVVATHQLDVGQVAQLELVHRGAPGLALVTFEADTLLEHRVVQLASGVNRIEARIDHAHFPNFFVSAAFMRRGQLWTDTTGFDVARSLAIELTPERTPLAPGDTARVRVRVRDSLGRPVEAELSLAVVDDGIFDLYPDLTRALSELSLAPRRPALFTTSSSALFAYAGRTQSIASAVLREAERARRAELERAERGAALSELDDVSKAGAPVTPGAVSTGSDEFFLGRGLEGERPGEPEGNAVGVGGGAAGRFGGRRSAKARGGAGAESDTPLEDLRDRGLAFWTPSVTTDAKGEATLEFSMPRESARWRVTARGCDAAELFGDARATLVTRSEFEVELRAPTELVEGDAPRFVARVHNQTGMTGKAKLTLRTRLGDEQQTYPLEVALGEAAQTEVVFPGLAPLARAGELVLELTAEAELTGTARSGSDAEKISARPYRPSSSTHVSSRVRPWGFEVLDAASGVLDREVRFELALDPARKCRDQRLELDLGPSIDALLVDAALGHTPLLVRSIESNSGTAAELLGACELLEAFESNGRGAAGSSAVVRARAQALVARLASAQHSSGTWGWSGASGVAHAESSALALVALASAATRGLEVPYTAVSSGKEALVRLFREASQQADESKALLSWAMAAHEIADFGALNRLHRQRATLSPAALAFTALALARSDRAAMATEVADELEKRASDFVAPTPRPTCRFALDGNAIWSRSELEMTAFAALALQRAKPASGRIAPALEFLLAQRPWFDARARGMAVAALARRAASLGVAAPNLRVTVDVGGTTRTLELDAARPGSTVAFDLAGRDRVSVALRVEGRGEPHFSAVLRGFSQQFESKSDVRATQSYAAETQREQGRAVQAGFSVLQDQTGAWVNTVTELEFGATTRAQLELYDLTKITGNEGDFALLRVPLPAGARVIDGSVACPQAERVEVTAGEIIVYLASRVGFCRLEYVLLGAAPGKYHVLPASIRGAFSPRREWTLAPMALAVLARGEETHDVYRATPDELYHRGIAKFEAGDRAGASALLRELVDAYEARLRDTNLSRSSEVLLIDAIERRSSRDIVRFFEILKEKNPDVYVPFESVLAVGAAYRELEEHERALSIFRATIEETFGKELRVVGTLEEQREHDGALRTLARLCAEYPDASGVLDASLSLADKLLALAPRAHAEPSLTAKKRTRIQLILESIFELQRFVALHPRDPRAPEAALNLVTAHLSLDDYAAASRLGSEFAEVFKEPRYADAFSYSRAVAEWYLGHDDKALDLLEVIAKAEYVDEDGKKSPSVNRELALYILAQIHHARQDFARASERYESVAEQFVDAREALASLREKRIALKEVTEVRPGQPVKLELSHRNVAQAELLVYPVDLMTLYLREKNLSNVTAVNLSGIAATVRRDVTLSAKEGMRPTTTSVELGVLEPGAYLVIGRGGELHASGLVLVSPLELDVKEDAEHGELRVQVIEQGTNKYVRNADVRVIGTLNSDFVSGRTDPRGLFVASGISGSATVIARSGDRQYAFYRGARALAVVASKPKQQVEQLDQEYFDNVLRFNEAAQNERGKNWSDELNRDRKGVQIRQVK